MAIFDNINGSLQKKYNALNRKFDYSTDEQVIGTWIDGKTLYRKVLHYNELTVADTATRTILTHNIGIGTVVNAHFWGSATWVASYYSETSMDEFRVNANEIIMAWGSGTSAKFTNVNIILEYTK